MSLRSGVHHAEDIDERSRPITDMLDAVGLQIGDRVLELACGAGGTGLAAAERIGADGEVVLSDVVPEMVDIAQRRATARTLGNVRTEVLDLEHISEPDEAFDVVLCREGMMFALEPRRAVAEMHRVLRPGGRATVAVWGPRSENPWLGVLLDTITEVTGIVVPPPAAPGPFALSDATELRDLFSDAGFGELAIDRVSAPLRAPSFSAWWNRQLKVAGPVIAVVNRLDETTRTWLHDTAQVATSRTRRTARSSYRDSARARRTPIMSAGPSKTFVVLGATGTIGRSVVELLAAKSGVTVRVATRTPTSLPATLRLRSVTAFAFDWDTPTGLDRLLRDCDAVLLIPPSGHPAGATATQVARAAAGAGVRHMVFLSTLGADFDPGFTFGRWALAGEHAVAAGVRAHTRCFDPTPT